MDVTGPTWLDDELAGCEFGDQRLGKRLRKLLGQIGGAMGESIPLACEDWANTKAAYRFFSNERVNEGEILAGHFQATRNRAAIAANGSSSSTTPQSSASRGKIRSRSASRGKFTAANTRNVARVCTLSAAY